MAGGLKKNLNYTLRINAGRASDTGLVRKHNEDSLLTLQLHLEDSFKGIAAGFYAVADGVGGYEGGEIASTLALRILSTRLTHSLLLPPSAEDYTSLSPEIISRELKESVELANRGIYKLALEKNNGMGTTLASALIIGNTVYIANVGDSRVYLLDCEQLAQVTTDHSLVADLLKAGEITPKEIYTHPRRNIITRCLGMQADIEVDLFVRTLYSGNSLLLCSDGLWEMVRDDEIKDTILRVGSPQSACRQLVKAANKNGGVDNISVIIVRVTG